MIIVPGKSAAVIGPSGTGKSHLAASAVRHHGSGIIMTIPGADEMPSYQEFFRDAAQPVWGDNDEVTIPGDARVIIAPFDDPDFAPSLGVEGLKGAIAQKRMVFFLRAVRQIVQKDIDEGKPPRWGVLVQDTFSAVSVLAVNATLRELNLLAPPPALSPEGSKYYGKLSTRMNDVVRASRVLKGLGMDWVTTSHVSMKDVSDAAKPGGATVASKEQMVPLMSGAFRDQFMGFFDITLHAEVTAKRTYKVRCDSDARRQSRARGAGVPLSKDGYLANDWPTIMKAYSSALNGVTLE